MYIVRFEVKVYLCFLFIFIFIFLYFVDFIKTFKLLVTFRKFESTLQLTKFYIHFILFKISKEYVSKNICKCSCSKRLKLLRNNSSYYS